MNGAGGATKSTQKSESAIRDTLPPELDEFVRNSSQGSITPAAPARAGAAPDISIGDVYIENGLLRYLDERSGLAQEFKAINARVAARSLTSRALQRWRARSRAISKFPSAHGLVRNSTTSK